MIDHKDLIIELNEIGAIKFGEFTLKSGAISPIYVDLRILVSYPKVMSRVAEAYAEVLEELTFDRMAAVPYAAMPIVAAVSAVNQRPWIFTRKEAKDYGTKKRIEGLYREKEKIVVVDDLTTNGASKLEVIEPFEQEGLVVEDIVVLLDREQGAAEVLRDKGYTLHSVLTMSEVLAVLKAADIINDDMLQSVKMFLEVNRAK